MLLKRVIVALIGIPLLLSLVYIGGLPFLCLVLLIIILGLKEFYNLVQKQGVAPLKIVGIIGALALGTGIYLNAGNLEIGFFLTIIILTLFLVRLSTQKIEGTALDISVTLLGVFYVGWLISHLILLRQLPHLGKEWTYLVFITTWSIDNGAYLIGMPWGKHKAVPQISPNKSIEGIIGGLAGGFLAVFIAKWWFLPYLSWVHCLGIGLLLGIMGQLGDLSESLIKRGAKVKDTGNFLPGHGGVLDRFDSLFFTAPVLYYYIKFFL